VVNQRFQTPLANRDEKFAKPGGVQCPLGHCTPIIVPSGWHPPMVLLKTAQYYEDWKHRRRFCTASSRPTRGATQQSTTEDFSARYETEPTATHSQRYIGMYWTGSFTRRWRRSLVRSFPVPKVLRGSVFDQTVQQEWRLSIGHFRSAA
jgi:hypothetical protein